MLAFDYARAESAADAIAKSQAGAEPKFLGGGTNLVDLMRETVERPRALVDVTGLSTAIVEQPDGSLLLGGGAKNTALVEHRAIRERYPLVARATLAGASAQIRNVATVAGNLLQRTRCAYFYDTEGSRCNKRSPGEGCDAIEGFHRIHAILGASPSCVATHPSDLAVALAALDALVHIRGPEGTRIVPLVDFHRLPADQPQVETVLQTHELITGVELPAASAGLASTYRKVRDRASYAFALVSVAATLTIEVGRVADVRVALGGVAHKPWRATKLEAALRGERASEEAFLAAADVELAGAQPLRDNAFKVPLARRTIAAVLGELAGGVA